MNYEKIKQEIKEIVDIASGVPDKFQEKCFEVLLNNFLVKEISPKQDVQNNLPSTPTQGQPLEGKIPIFDTDLIVVLEGMELLDGNRADRLRVCFQYRNQSAHPGDAPIEEPHLVAFFTDINSIVSSHPTVLRKS